MKDIGNIFMYALGAIVVIGFFFLMAFLIKFEIPKANENILHLVIGALIGSFTSVVGFFFGSSKGSKDKTELIAKK